MRGVRRLLGDPEVGALGLAHRRSVAAAGEGGTGSLLSLGAPNVIVMAGVHFMAETADILANRPGMLDDRSGERIPVILPDLAAGCSMADMGTP